MKFLSLSLIKLCSSVKKCRLWNSVMLAAVANRNAVDSWQKKGCRLTTVVNLLISTEHLWKQLHLVSQSLKLPKTNDTPQLFHLCLMSICLFLIHQPCLNLANQRRGRKGQLQEVQQTFKMTVNYSFVSTWAPSGMSNATDRNMTWGNPGSLGYRYDVNGSDR